VPTKYDIYLAYGIIGGIFAYVIINGFVYIVDKASRGRIHPDYSNREDWWTAVMSRSFIPLWMRYLIAKAKGQEFDWHQDELDFDDEIVEPDTATPTVIVDSEELETISSRGRNEKS
jgi:AGZA family xanthine/uracil permease-like MFS transporter